MCFPLKAVKARVERLLCTPRQMNSDKYAAVRGGGAWGRGPRGEPQDLQCAEKLLFPLKTEKKAVLRRTGVHFPPQP